MNGAPLIVRRPPAERLPDGSDYVTLPGGTPAMPDRCGGGIVRLPAGVTSWQHNHLEREVFVVLNGRLSFHWDDGSAVLEEGDCVIVPPLTTHRFEADRGGEAQLFHAYWDDRCDAPAVAAQRLMRSGGDALVVHDASDADAVRLSEVCARRLRQRGTAVTRLSTLSVPGPAHRGADLPLEQRRSELQTALDRVCCNARLQRAVGTLLAAPLPPATAEDASGARALLHHTSWRDAAAGTRVLIYFPLAHTLRYAGALPLLALAGRQTVPCVLFACEPGAAGAATEPDWRHWGAWLTGLFCDIATRGDAVAPDAGRWNARQQAALCDASALLSVAGNALQPEQMDLGAFARGLDAVVGRMQRLADSDPCVAGSESFAAEARTTQALQLAVARQLVRELHAPWPEPARLLAAALGVPGDSDGHDPAGITFLAPGTRLDDTALRRFFDAVTPGAWRGRP